MRFNYFKMELKFRKPWKSSERLSMLETEILVYSHSMDTEWFEFKQSYRNGCVEYTADDLRGRRERVIAEMRKVSALGKEYENHFVVLIGDPRHPDVMNYLQKGLEVWEGIEAVLDARGESYYSYTE
jgi:hypothetical protein